MSWKMNTLNSGAIEMGYLAGDVGRVGLGQAGPISTRQFAGYAALTLVRGVFPDITRELRAEWALYAHQVREHVDTQTAGDPRLIALEEPHHYRQNPFTPRIDGQTVCIANRHEVTSENFFHFTNYVLAGGVMGWQGVTYQEVKDAVVALDVALATPPTV